MDLKHGNGIVGDGIRKRVNLGLWRLGRLGQRKPADQKQQKGYEKLFHGFGKRNDKNITRPGQSRNLSRLTARCLFDEPLPDGMDEVGIGRSEPGGTHIGGNLAAMIGRVQDHVQQDILLLAGEAFALGVLVRSRIG